MDKQNGRLTIGFQSLSLYGNYYKTLLYGIHDEVNEQDVNLILFPGRCYQYSNRYEYQNSLIYNFMTLENIDGLIITPGSMIDLVGLESTLQFYRKFEKFPMVSLNIGVPGASVIGINNHEGFRKLLAHLFGDHGFKRPAFIHGSRENEEAHTRYVVYREMLREYGIPDDEQRVVFGDFTDASGRSAVIELLDVRHVDCDVIVASNDAMAFGVLDELSKKRISVPYEIAVTGFDNVMESSTCIPPLTTVAQPLYEQARQAVKSLIALIRREQVDDSILFETQPLIRKSCGCTVSGSGNRNIRIADNTDDPFEAFMSVFSTDALSTGIIDRCRALDKAYFRSDTGEGSSLINDLNRLLLETADSENSLDIIRAFIDVLDATIMSTPALDDRTTARRRLLDSARNLINDYRENRQAHRILENDRIVYQLRFLIRDCSASINLEQFLDVVHQLLSSFGIRNFFIMLFNPPIVHQDGKEPPCPDKIRLLISNPEVRASIDSDIVFSYPLIIPKVFLPDNGNFMYIATALYFMEEQYGFVLMDYRNESYEIYEILATQISTTYKRSLMVDEISDSERKLRSALDQLQTYTHHLQHISERDELTGLYNRRGFVSLASAALESAETQGRCSLLFFFDLDGLKRINDNHGHDEGDHALKRAATILHNSMRSSDILGRLGGDEFVVFASNVAMEYVDTVIERISLKTASSNKETDKPYAVSMTCGWAVSSPEACKDLNRLLHEADEMLYKNKKR